MNELRIGTVLDNAWALTKKHGLWLCLMLLLLYIINQVISTLLCGIDTMELIEATQSGNTAKIMKVAQNMTVTAAPGIVISEIIGLCLGAAFFNTLLLIAKGKMEKVDFSGFKMSVMTYIKYVLASLLLAVIVGIGTACCIIPGIFLLVRLILTTIAIIDNPELPFFDAFRKSWKLTKGHFWTIFGLGITILFLNLIGFCCCCVGVLVTMVISEFALVVVYVTLTEDDEPAEPEVEAEPVGDNYQK